MLIVTQPRRNFLNFIKGVGSLKSTLYAHVRSNNGITLAVSIKLVIGD